MDCESTLADQADGVKPARTAKPYFASSERPQLRQTCWSKNDHGNSGLGGNSGRVATRAKTTKNIQQMLIRVQGYKRQGKTEDKINNKRVVRLNYCQNTRIVNDRKMGGGGVASVSNRT